MIHRLINLILGRVKCLLLKNLCLNVSHYQLFHCDMIYFFINLGNFESKLKSHFKPHSQHFRVILVPILWISQNLYQYPAQSNETLVQHSYTFLKTPQNESEFSSIKVYYHPVHFKNNPGNLHISTILSTIAQYFYPVFCVFLKAFSIYL